MTTNEPPPTPGSPPPPAPGAPPPPPPPASISESKWRGLRVPSYFVCAGFVGHIVLVLYAIVTLLEQRGLVPDSFSDFSRSDAQRLIDLDDRVDTINDLFLALVLIILVTMMVWMWRAAKNNEALGRVQPRFGPGWSIGGWLIPLANLVIPVLIMQDLWRGSDSSVPRGDPRWKVGNRSMLVGFWWGLFLFGRVLVAAGVGNVEPGDLDSVRSGIDLQLVGNLITIAAAVLGILVVRKITERQEECLRVQNEQWTPPPPPPAS